MISDKYFWFNIVCLGIGTIAIRGSIIAISARVKISDRMREIFSFIPAAILPALVAPAVFFHQGKSALLWGKERFVVAVLATVVCYFSRSTLATIASGLIGLYLLSI